MATAFDRAFREMPDSVSLDVLAHKTLDDLIFQAETELDLISEGQDGTEPKDAPKIRRWLKKWRKVDTAAK